MTQTELKLSLPIQGRLRLLPVELLVGCKNEREALRVCLDNAAMSLTDTQWAALLGISKGQLSEYFREDGDKPKHIPERIRMLAQKIANNLAINQYWDLQFRHTPVPMGHNEEVRMLEQRLEALKK
jgi:hypothetical protein